MRNYRAIVWGVMTALLLILNGCGSINPWMKADKLFKENKYAEAAEAYAQASERYPERRELVFNRGAALHMAQDCDRAIKVFQTLAKEARSELQEKCEYNTGNGYLRKGDKEKAIEHYKRALYLRHDDLNAKWNLELAQRQPQQKQQEDKQDEQQQDQPDKDEDDKQQQAGQEQQDQQQDRQPTPKQDGQLSKKEAERLLRALAEEDKELQKQMRKPKEPITTPPRGKDW